MVQMIIMSIIGSNYCLGGDCLFEVGDYDLLFQAGDYDFLVTWVIQEEEEDDDIYCFYLIGLGYGGLQLTDVCEDCCFGIGGGIVDDLIGIEMNRIEQN
ncbi:MAG: hypothetical protein EZS28_019510 [Streblomastix strix]|uniref:Uncharacterized protein n=1 Tax=Streblomastix strix TaxID=222440 RepID=A0A5J4VRZ2_9EUKA|nr:MAG: hypothetical protein EZS28_019510 [Streblomastix strix]